MKNFSGISTGNRNFHISGMRKMLRTGINNFGFYFAFMILFLAVDQNLAAQNTDVCQNLQNVINGAQQDFKSITGPIADGNAYTSKAYVNSNTAKIYFNVDMKKQVFEEALLKYPDSVKTQKQKTELYNSVLNNISNCLPQQEWVVLREKDEQGNPYVHLKNLGARVFMMLKQRPQDVALIVYHQVESTQKCLKGNCQNGFGTIQYENGDVYEGHFLSGRRIGVGRYVWAEDGSRYEGSWLADSMNGFGHYTEAGTEQPKRSYMYMSNFIEVDTTKPNTCVYGDCSNGYGMYHYGGGEIYIGNFKNGLQNGLGAFESKKGNYYGFFKDGKYHGEGIFYLPSGSVYRGAFVEGKQQGKGVEFVSGNSSIEGNYSDSSSTFAGKEFSPYGIMTKKGAWKDKKFIPSTTSYDKRVLEFAESLNKIYEQRENEWQRLRGNRYRKKDLLYYDCMVKLKEAATTLVRVEGDKTYVRAEYHISPVPKDIAAGRFEMLVGYLKESLNNSWIPEQGENNDNESTANRSFYFKNAENPDSHIDVKVENNMVYIDIF